MAKTNKSKKDKVYFPGLNGLRFIAAACVVVTHIELLKKGMGYSNIWKEPLIFEAGPLGVVFFFVLSGFLITYLLFKEKEQTKNVAIKEFYLRRIFRIWPLYYFVTILVFFLFPLFGFSQLPYYSPKLEENFFSLLWMYLLMLPNLAMSIFPSVPLGGHLWSIGVEEQFYLMWPALLKFSKNIIRTIVITGLVVLSIKTAILIWSLLYPEVAWLKYLKNFAAMTKLECMVLGSIGAYWLFHDRVSVLKVIFHKSVQWISYVSIPLLIYYTPSFLQDGVHLVFSLFFLVIIMNVSSNRKSLIKLEFSVLDYLGKISYGIYMYHMIAIILIIRSMEWIGLGAFNLTYWNALVYGGSFLLTILFAGSSYRWFEKPFLKQKSRFAKVVSGDQAKEKVSS